MGLDQACGWQFEGLGVTVVWGIPLTAVESKTRQWYGLSKVLNYTKDQDKEIKMNLKSKIQEHD